MIWNLSLKSFIVDTSFNFASQKFCVVTKNYPVYWPLLSGLYFKYATWSEIFLTFDLNWRRNRELLTVIHLRSTRAIELCERSYNNFDNEAATRNTIIILLVCGVDECSTALHEQ